MCVTTCVSCIHAYLYACGEGGRDSFYFFSFPNYNPLICFLLHNEYKPLTCLELEVRFSDLESSDEDLNARSLSAQYTDLKSNSQFSSHRAQSLFSGSGRALFIHSVLRICIYKRRLRTIYKYICVYTNSMII